MGACRQTREQRKCIKYAYIHWMAPTFPSIRIDATTRNLHFATHKVQGICSLRAENNEQSKPSLLEIWSWLCAATNALYLKRDNRPMGSRFGVCVCVYVCVRCVVRCVHVGRILGPLRNYGPPILYFNRISLASCECYGNIAFVFVPTHMHLWWKFWFHTSLTKTSTNHSHFCSLSQSLSTFFTRISYPDICLGWCF